jgi:prepilin-type N-terminal cleavage/methylation domain-containing protein
MCSKKGFTIIEILLVVAIISLAIMIAFPAANKLSTKFNSYLENVEKRHLEKKENFQRFLNDE